MTELQKFSSLVGSLYDCVPDPARWQQTLQALTDYFDGMMATLAVLDSEKNQARFGAYCGDPEIVLPLITTYANDMPFFHLVPKFEVDVPNTMQDLFDLHGPDGRDVFKKTRLYTEWHEGNGIADCLAVLVMKQQGRVGALNIVTSKRRRPISKEDQSRLELLAPHIRRSVVIGDLFELNQRDEQVFKEVIDSFSYAVFVVGKNMQLHYANPQAETMLRDGFAVQASFNTLAFRNELAQAAISKAVTLGERDEVALGATGIGVPLARVQRPAVAHVLPLGRRIAGAQFHSNAIAAIFVATAGQNPVPAIEAIAALFGLTAAEKRVAGQVASGMTRNEISAASGVSDGTIKSQLAAIYDKTGAGGQRELELLIRDLTPPVKTR
jgi:DNA-binding CsgD family transcriptional regulator